MHKKNRSAILQGINLIMSFQDHSMQSSQDVGFIESVMARQKDKKEE